MRYWLNIPLAIAAISLATVFNDVVVSAVPHAGDAAIGAAYATFFGLILGWLMLVVVVVGCGAIGGLAWPALRGFTGAVVAAIGFAVIILIALLPLGIATDLNGTARYGSSQASAARLVAFGLPLIVSIYAGWMINVPAIHRANRTAPHGAALGAIGLLCLVAAFVSVRELGRQDEQTRADAAVARQREDEEAQQVRRNFAALTDADPLASWDAYVGFNVPDDVRVAALRRITARPTLEAELVRMLADSNWNWSDEALSLIVRLDFRPSEGLVVSIHAALDAMAAQLTEASREVTFERDRWFDREAYRRLTMALAVADKMADITGADMRNAIDELVAAAALFAGSEAERLFMAEAAKTKAHIGATLEKRTH